MDGRIGPDARVWAEEPADGQRSRQGRADRSVVLQFDGRCGDILRKDRLHLLR